MADIQQFTSAIFEASSVSFEGTDIGVTSRRDQRYSSAGPLNILDTNPFTHDSVSYPLDLNELSHAMIFNINVSDAATDMKGVSGLGESRTQNNLGGTIGGAGISSADINNITNPILSGDLAKIGSEIQLDFTLNRKTKRISQSIALYIPESGMQFPGAQDYATSSLLETLGVGGVALAAGLSTDDDGQRKTLITAGMLGLAGKVLGLTGPLDSALSPGGVASTAIKAGLGYAINPIINVLYNAPNLRTFKFSFVFAPRSSQEADAVWKIIQLFRSYSAPDYVNDGKGLAGAFFVPPAEWDITFLRKDSSHGGFVQNTNIPGMTTCVLTNIDVNYAPEGNWTTFDDGMPVVTQVEIEFTELEILTRKKINAGY